MNIISASFISEREPTPPPSIRHYDPTEEKGRVFGPSHIPLPQNEDERQQKIKELKEASAKTSDIRQKRKKQLTEQKRAEREKLKRFRARLDLSPLPSTSEEEDNEEGGEAVSIKYFTSFLFQNQRSNLARPFKKDPRRKNGTLVFVNGTVRRLAIIDGYRKNGTSEKTNSRRRPPTFDDDPERIPPLFQLQTNELLFLYR